MRKSVYALFVVLVFAAVPEVRAACTETGFFRDGINMTAALINPPGTLSGPVDAKGCNVGVYYDGGNNVKISNADVYGANYFGVLVNTDNGGTSNVSIKGSIVHNIGEVPHNGSQHGVGIYLRGFAGSIKGVVDGNWVFDYQKGGITANGPGINVDITHNTVIGDGHVAFIAQNGIQMAYGASNNTIADNYVYGNSYFGTQNSPWASGGILVAGGPGYVICLPAGAECGYDVNLRIRGNTLVANDVGVFLYNGDANGDAPPTPTNIEVTNNTIYGDKCYNQLYQAGISDVGNRDKLINNTIYGPGYTDPACATAHTIDVSDATGAIVRTPRPKPHR